MNKFRITISVLLGLIIPISSWADAPRFMPALSKARVDSNFKIAEVGFKQRWKHFATGKKFEKYSPNFDEQELHAKFSNIKTNRQAAYYENPTQQPQRSKIEFERSQLLMTNGFYKSLHHIAFAYNSSHPSYNASNIIINGHKFLALEGPQKLAHVNNFLRLLVNYDVKQLVRLTKDYEKQEFKTENYWNNSIKINATEQQLLTFKLTDEDPSQTSPYTILYYGTDHWLDFAGVDPEHLLEMVQKVRKDYKPGNIIAVHCSAGVGRTGAFIATFLLFNEIDRQLAKGIQPKNINLSIEEFVYKLSLQRAYAVSEPQQYVNLHQVVKLYIAKCTK